MAWRLVRSLETQRGQVRAAASRAVPPATPASSWGTIGDAEHDPDSDHSPHVYAALGSTAVVCAADYPHAPALGLDGHAFTEALRQSRDPRIGYVIFDGRIFSGHQVGSVPAFVWRTYTGKDKHRTHWHVSVVHTAAADDTRPWAMPGGMTTGTDMELSTPTGWTKQFLPNAPGVKDGPWLGGTVGAQLQYIRETTHASFVLDQLNSAAITALTSVIEQLTGALAAGGGGAEGLTVAAILAGVDERLTAFAAETRDAVADLGEGGAAQVRADTDGQGD
jgi:hypothetical protein